MSYHQAPDKEKERKKIEQNAEFNHLFQQFWL